MLTRRVAAIAAFSITISTVIFPAVANADTGTTLYVNNAASANCSDSTTNSATTPYCTIQAAADVVTAGQTVLVAAGTYAPFTITASGTAGSPITVEAADPPASTNGSGPTRYTTVQSSTATVAPITISDASYVDVSGFGATSTSGTGANGSSEIYVAGSSNITIDRVYATRTNDSTSAPAVEIDGGSSAVTVSRSWLFGALASDLRIDAGSSNDVITTNVFLRSGGSGVVVYGAPDTDITSNTFLGTCGNGILLTGASDNSSVQNNIVENVGPSTTPPAVCSSSAVPPNGIEVDSAATTGTTLDYNIVYAASTGSSDYNWAGAGYSTASALYNEVGQGQHDVNSGPGAGTTGIPSALAINSANSSAPGELATDLYGQERIDDPTVPSTGAGSFAYYDRGAIQLQGSVTVSGFNQVATQAPVGGVVTFSEVGKDSWGGPLYYSYQFGDGTYVTNTSGTATHAYSATGSYPVTLYVRHSEFGPVASTVNVVIVNVDPAGPLVAELSAPPSGALSVAAYADSSTSPWGIASYDYDFGDGTSGTGPFITHTYATPGTYLITLTVTDKNGATAKTTASFTTAGSDYTAYGPTRILDTRNGTGVAKGKLGPSIGFFLKVAGVGSIPSDVTAIVLNLTATNTNGSGFISDGGITSTLNYSAGRTTAVAAIIPVSSDGTINLTNLGADAGPVDLIGDISGYFTQTVASGYTALSPDRLLDTRNGTGTGGVSAKVRAGASLPLTIAGADSGSLPPGITAVALNVTVTNPTGIGFITAYPDGTSIPTASNLNYAPGQTVANTIICPVSGDGTIDLYNGGSTASPVDLIADVTGYYSTFSAGALVPLSGDRLLDTRSSGALGKGGSVTIDPSTILDSGVPGSATGFVFNTTVTGPTGSGFITAYPTGEAVPNVSNLNYTPGLTIANLAQVSAGTGGAVSFYNGGSSAGTTQLIVDLFGYYDNS